MKKNVKQLPDGAGVYQFRCIANGRVHRCASDNMPLSAANIRRTLNNKQHPCKALQDDWDQYPDKFVLDVIWVFKSPSNDRTNMRELTYALNDNSPSYNHKRRQRE